MSDAVIIAGFICVAAVLCVVAALYAPPSSPLYPPDREMPRFESKRTVWISSRGGKPTTVVTSETRPSKEAGSHE